MHVHVPPSSMHAPMHAGTQNYLCFCLVLSGSCGSCASVPSTAAMPILQLGTCWESGELRARACLHKREGRRRRAGLGVRGAEGQGICVFRESEISQTVSQQVDTISDR